ncbi:LysM peptidoglycan-binding domain-containing protein [Paenibacillus alvei]|uniref:M14 family zinc carboxypeptidase n=1 Tax=Paenibacillus sp. TaxID=58172 RepID=UPI0012FBD840|nr:M14 family zinc carboxypeptidase [Paenibacillus alvei]MCY9540597.1 LysM peptidoglycan-binding domain-containing protein [Paenibacillus alvei]MCY9706998.1 LysM peptidoglycan-binding domain-containing protein [Paenibacillus alvei]MCY9736032.1 LysM peptidoglycan-binding domain-containing protein [Paenibacillus alvei]MCY9755904.1 LysM peptidoglycan-binding domain-containing protein [Paenibacillus alvei]MEC0082323.1 M14 family zinc carboxypeptidase [Paenibacillus alvei]
MAVPYVVQKGDTYLRICARHGIQLHALLSANPQLRADGYAVPGQVIDIPDPPINKYVVQAKDRFYHIAQRFQVSTQRLAEANPTLDPRRLIPGQLMLIPFEYSTQWERKTAEYGYAQMMRDIGQLQNSHSFIRVEQIGNSVMGKPIPAIIIGKGTVPVHANGSVHANEWITSALLMQFVEDYARAYDSGEAWNGWDALAAFERTTLWMVPMSNPDGVELVQEGISPEHPLYASIMEWNQGSRKFQRWKANIRGIDLNDQFPAYWEEEQARRGVYAPAPLNYGGTRPLTEPEAIALAELSERIPFEMALSFHTQGQEIYWNYRDYEPDDACSWAERFQRASGYRAVKLSGSDAGYKDWFIQRYRKPGFTIEVGNGVSPLPLDDFDAMYREVAAIMKEALLP